MTGADETASAARIERLARRATLACEWFVPPANPPDEARALDYLREGLGPTVWCYVEGRTGGRRVAFSPAEFARLERTMNDWLDLYAACYGVDLDAEFSLRTAAELLVETRDVRDTAALLTHVPDRHGRGPRGRPHAAE
ncbi:hypothetical protein [Halomarina litorea]|uniref:hypothetical protein n=1 Tax=Halomarina litorea TaxID=2961595 RepID=UPI0020C292DF|nr:hypothetical protein [Halomarina sp. BCD28]